MGSFVSHNLLPQMADCATLVRETKKIGKVTILALVPNLKGAEKAIAAGARKLTMPPSASRAHSLKNIGKTPEEAIEEVRRVCVLRDSLPLEKRPDVEVGISTAFGCTIEGIISEDWVIEMAGLLAKAGADSIGLSDTTGHANPLQVKKMFRRLQSEIGAEKMGGAHLHNTRGQGLANVVAALEVGIKTFDSSLGGLGGCPYAPGATGNIVTEDLVFMLEAMGLHTCVVSDKQWTLFCEGFGLDDLLQDEKLKTNAQRVARRGEFMPYLREMFAMQNLSQAAKICENVGLPFAPIMRPDQLFDDPHLNHPGATVEVTLSNGVKAQVPTLPIEYNQTRLSLYRDLPEVGEHNETVARELDYSDEELERLRPSLDSSVVAETD